MSARILLTGFKPFGGRKENCSEILVNHLVLENPNWDSCILPVSFSRSYSVLQHQIQTQGPYGAIIQFGEASSREKIGLEKVALNWHQSKNADEDGAHPETGKIISGAPDAYLNSFLNPYWADELTHFAPTENSYSAGAFVCNALYFESMHRIDQKESPVLFVHLPYFETISLQKQMKVVQKLLERVESGLCL